MASNSHVQTTMIGPQNTQPPETFRTYTWSSPSNPPSASSKPAVCNTNLSREFP